MKRWDNWVRGLTFALFVVLMVNQKFQLWLGLFLITLVLARWLGRLYCGYICPLNTSMLVAEKLRKTFKIKELKQPRFLSYKHLSWITLAIMIGFMIFGQVVLKKQPPILPILTVSAFVVALFYHPSFFHNHLCPYNAPLKLFGSKATFSKHVTTKGCIGCTKCEKVCPSHAIVVVKTTRKAVIDRALCHQCQECTAVCPTHTISYKKAV
ncbi:MAG: 4Fe-4S binding protein [Erysipelothrix sp.]|nr:4Fe-4S binding protein [Erysipelothrix sp.]